MSDIMLGFEFICYNCGKDNIVDESDMDRIFHDAKYCCSSCKNVYRILNIFDYSLSRYSNGKDIYYYDGYENKLIGSRSYVVW